MTVLTFAENALAVVRNREQHLWLGELLEAAEARPDRCETVDSDWSHNVRSSMKQTETAAQRFNRTALSRRDFHEACEFLKALPSEDSRTIRYALLTAAIIAYARPFSGNERDGNAEASRHLHIDPSAILNGEQVTLHKHVIRLRNKLVAHAEFVECPVRLLDSRPDGMTLSGPYVAANGHQYDLRNYLELLDVAMFQRIADIVGVHCLNEMYKLKDQDARTSA